jgi:hypothetical protein
MNLTVNSGTVYSHKVVYVCLCVCVCVCVCIYDPVRTRGNFLSKQTNSVALTPQAKYTD